MARPMQEVKGLRRPGSPFHGTSEAALGRALHDRRSASQQVVSHSCRGGALSESAVAGRPGGRAFRRDDRRTGVVADAAALCLLLNSGRGAGLRQQWQEWQPRGTRAYRGQGLAVVFVTLAVEHGAKTPDGLRVTCTPRRCPTRRAAESLSTRNGWRRIPVWRILAGFIENELPKDRPGELAPQAGRVPDGRNILLEPDPHHCSGIGAGCDGVRRNRRRRVATAVQVRLVDARSPEPSGASTSAPCPARRPWRRRSMQSSRNNPAAGPTE